MSTRIITVTPPAATGRPFIDALRSPVATALVGVVLIAAHVIFSAEQYPVTARVLAGLLGVLVFVIVRRASQSRIPFFEYAALQMYIFFGMATFWDQELTSMAGPVMLSEKSLVLASLASLGSLTLMYVMTFPGERLGERIRSGVQRYVPFHRQGDFDFGVRIVVSALVVLFLLHSFARGLIPSGLGQPVAILARPMLAQALLYEALRRSPSKANKLLFWGYTFVAIIAGLNSGMLKEVVVPVLTAFLLVWLHRGTFKLHWIVGLVLAFLVLNPAKHYYRVEKVERMELGEEMGIAKSLDLWGEAFVATWVEEGGNPYTEENLSSTTLRISALLNVAHAIEWVPVQIPYSGIDRWLTIPATYVPRLLWPDKPDMTRAHNGEYALTFSLQSEQALDHTAINFPLITDGYWALGWPGVIFVSLVVGLLYGGYRGLFQTAGWGETVIALAMLPYLMPHHHLAQHLSGIPQRIVMFLVVVWTVDALARSKGKESHASDVLRRIDAHPST